MRDLLKLIIGLVGMISSVAFFVTYFKWAQNFDFYAVLFVKAALVGIAARLAVIAILVIIAFVAKLKKKVMAA